MAGENSGPDTASGTANFDSLFLANAAVITPVRESGSEIAGTDFGPEQTKNPEHDDLARALADAPAPQWTQPEPAAVFDFSDRPDRTAARTPPLVWAALVFAIVVPPVGLVLSIVARTLPRRGRLARSWPLPVATTVSIVLTIVLIVVAAIGGIFAKQAADEAAIVSASAGYCASLAETPGVLSSPGFGWPIDKASVSDSIASMTAYEERWQNLALIAPAGVASDTTAIAETAAALISSAESSRTIDVQGNLDRISSVTGATAIPAYVAKYCGN